MTFDQLIGLLLQFQQQLKVCHWQTKSHSRHIAFGNAYENIDEQLDEMVECFMGKYGKIKFSSEVKTIDIWNISELNLNEFIDNIRTILVDLETVVNDNDKDILAIRDNMLITINKLVYLLTLE